MARKTNLGELVQQLRGEVGYSLTAALGSANRDVLIAVIQRTQRKLWEDFAWPFMRVKSDIASSKALRYYNIPSNLTCERIEKIEFKDGGYWRPLDYGIGGAQLSVHDSDTAEEGWPVTRWEIYGEDQFEVWPIANTNGTASTLEGYFRLTGIKNLAALVDDDDRADLDDHLIILYAAAELLARNKAADAEAKLANANTHYARLRARLSKSDMVRMGGSRTQANPVLRGAKIV